MTLTQATYVEYVIKSKKELALETCHSKKKYIHKNCVNPA